MFTPSLLILLASAGLIEARSLHQVRHIHGLHYRRQADSTTLSADALQIGSTVDGTTSIGSNVAQQAASLTSENNFINFCSGKQLTNGFQHLDGSCNGIAMGDIPAKTSMISSMIIFPEPGSDDVQSNETFNITVQVNNLVAGAFTNADATYYSAPQQLQDGKVVGHTHITVQDLGDSLNPTTALDPTIFAFFKGINDAGNGQGLLSATVTGGLPAGNYRVCTMTSAANHQPVLMPVAQRGTPDDCTKFIVSGNGNTKNDAANDGAKGIAAAELAQSAIDAGPGFVSVKSSAAAGATGVSSAIIDDGSGVVVTSAITTQTAESSAAATESAESSSFSAPFSNSTTTRRGGNGGGRPARPTKVRTGGSGGKGGAATSVVTSAAVQTSKAGDVAITKTRGGNAGTKVVTAPNGKPTGKRIITIIKTFFVFRKFRGGACPAVSKNGNQFNVLDDLFEDLASAAAAACGHQFTACLSFEGPGFSFEECQSQKDDCAAVASTQSATASTPETLTASITIPISATATVPGSVVATETIAPTSVPVASQSAADEVSESTSEQAAQTSAPAAVDNAASSSACNLVTQTVTVDAPVTSSTSVPSVASLPTLVTPSAPFSNSTATSSSAPAASSAVASTGAIGGIDAPAIQDSGDSSRPFLVNGNTFANRAAAVQRSCDVQFNKCANAVNGGQLTGVTLADCDAQKTTCSAQ